MGDREPVEIRRARCCHGGGYGRPRRGAPHTVGPMYPLQRVGAAVSNRVSHRIVFDTTSWSGWLQEVGYGMNEGRGPKVLRPPRGRRAMVDGKTGITSLSLEPISRTHMWTRTHRCHAGGARWVGRGPGGGRPRSRRTGFHGLVSTRGGISRGGAHCRSRIGARASASTMIASTSAYNRVRSRPTTGVPGPVASGRISVSIMAPPPSKVERGSVRR